MSFFILYRKMCPHLEVLHNLLNQYFPNDQYTVLQNHIMVKDLFKVQGRLIDFNVTEVKSALMWFQIPNLN